MSRLQRLRPLFHGLALISLSACATTSIGTPSRYDGGAPSSGQPRTAALPAAVALDDAERLAADGRALDAASRYEQAATGAEPMRAASYRLRAAELANAGNDPARADLILDQIPAGPLDAHQQSRYRLLRAQTALARNDPARVLVLLPAGDPGGEPSIAAAQLLTRARALTRIGDAVGATQALVQREAYLQGGSAVGENHDLIWTALNAASLDSATLGRAASMAPPVRGWIELAALARRSAPLQDYEAWRHRFPGHPGEDRLATLFVAARNEAPPPPASGPVAVPVNGGGFDTLASSGGSVALLLPGSGPLAAIGDAVRAGYAAAAAKAGAPEAHGYDSAAGVPAAYQRAVTEASGVIVGPLRKEDAAALAQAGPVAVPVLALNYLDGGRAGPAGFYQFGLAPEDEARAAAEDAVARGLRLPVAMVPAGDWGNRVLAAFEQRLRELGGHVVESGRYSGDPQNWSDPVRRVLRYVAIDDKRKAAEARAKAGPGIDPQRRNDFDFVFIAGRAAQARVLWPLFRYYHADRLPAYATAAVYEGDSDSDLSGIRFCDAPWALDAGGPWAALAAEARDGRSFENARLYALGNDAFLIASRIAQNQLRPGDELAGATGVLKVDSAGAVHRRLVCAQMTSGAPYPLPAP